MSVLYPPNTFLECQDEVLGHGFSALRYRARVKRWLNDGWRRTARKGRITAGVGEATLSVSAGSGAILALPNDFVRVEYLWLTQPTPDLLMSPVSRPIIQALSEGAQGPPTVYAVNDATATESWNFAQIDVRPVADAAYNFVLRYRRVPPMLVDDGEFSPFAPEYDELAVNYALWHAYQAEHDRELALHHKAEWQFGLMAILTDESHRQPPPKQIAGLLQIWGDTGAEGGGGAGMMSIPIPGPAGPPGEAGAPGEGVDVFEQDDEPVEAGEGDIWIETDEP